MLEKNFRFEKSEPDGGDAGCWLPLVSRIRRLDVKQTPTHPPLCETVEQVAATVEVSSVLPGYRAASVFISEPTGRGWGQDGGWNDATAGQFPDTLEIKLREPRRLRQIDVYTLADQWKTLDRVDAPLEFQRYGITELDVEVQPPDGAWRVVRQIRENRKVVMSILLDEAPVAAIRLRVVGSADNQFSRIVHVDLR
jgi:alpha-L-rhamnosidase